MYLPSLKNILYAMLGLGLASPTLLAQMTEDRVSLRFSCLSLGTTLTDYHYDDDSGSHKLTITNGSRTPMFHYSGPAELVFYTPEIGEAGEITKRPLARVNLRGKTGDQLFVFFPANGGYHIYPMDDGRTSFPTNAWRVYNLTPHPLALKAGHDDPTIIQSGAFQTMVSRADVSQSERVQVGIHRENTWELVYQSLWGRRPHVRTLIFLIPMDDGKRVGVRRFNQTLPGVDGRSG